MLNLGLSFGAVRDKSFVSYMNYEHETTSETMGQ